MPLALIVAGAGTVIALLRKWSKKSGGAPVPATKGAAGGPATKPSRDEYDDRLDDELKRMDE